jgi:hypothetical protein
MHHRERQAGDDAAAADNHRVRTPSSSVVRVSSVHHHCAGDENTDCELPHDDLLRAVNDPKPSRSFLFFLKNAGYRIGQGLQGFPPGMTSPHAPRGF